ncbi:MAG: metal-dependent transcriptional regulator [Oscillospiraceae bacterium]|jgi:Mn-dependent DtxR family transcriptional regulator|nr:metal-dependent transcriptional regulator [Oscillospiraceae bacterium]
MKIQESAENYLETILVLGMEGEPVHAVDIAQELGFSKPSVSVAMKNLRAGGYVAVRPDGAITLTDTGREIAERMYERHTFLTDWLMSLGVTGAAAARDACRIEHVISAESFQALKRANETQ